MLIDEVKAFISDARKLDFDEGCDYYEARDWVNYLTDVIRLLEEVLPELESSQTKAFDAQTTRLFTIVYVLSAHCGKCLTPDILDSIAKELCNEIEHGPSSWAFKNGDKSTCASMVAKP